jgi:type 1 glutamine amidotransferase
LATLFAFGNNKLKRRRIVASIEGRRSYWFRRRNMRFWLAAILSLSIASATSAQPDRGAAILVFSHTTGFRHDSIPDGIRAISEIAGRRGIQVVASEDPRMFDAATLRRFKAIVLLSTTTDPKLPGSEWLVGQRRSALQQFVEDGGGILAIHAAADSHYHWPWYGHLIGGRFERHPPGTAMGRIRMIDPSSGLGRGLPAAFDHRDEWYYFADFDPTSTLVATVDPASIGEKDINPNPVAWTRKVGHGRVFYTAMGHTKESYSEPDFLKHLDNGLAWVVK